MNKQQRKEWEQLVEECLDGINTKGESSFDVIIANANTYILKLERELQNIKQGKKIAAILMPHGGPR